MAINMNESGNLIAAAITTAAEALKFLFSRQRHPVNHIKLTREISASGNFHESIELCSSDADAFHTQIADTLRCWNDQNRLIQSGTTVHFGSNELPTADLNGSIETKQSELTEISSFDSS